MKLWLKSFLSKSRSKVGNLENKEKSSSKKVMIFVYPRVYCLPDVLLKEIENAKKQLIEYEY